ncbi:hypothetical protein CNBC2290 [Cryptococcus deneoformans B-3501A]|uniref:hypothetical protein n=1 Tax=Cryptococcus deneoformans (strain B-3501A) TaxID=283643 RepID=UPI000042F769|nr:hypothetical protein CNBC2290 [Cryptococcus neoformans var. neoformans B-3501A]EAL22091.1 hypothetical protein CNBC2290 [Cryptococcus neoformans var. neoformans B-3501A]
MDNHQHLQQHPPPPVFSMTIAMPGPAPPRSSPPADGSDAHQAADSNQGPAQESTIYWTFHIGPGSVRSPNDNQSSNEHPAVPGPNGRSGEPRGPAEGGGDANNNAPPPWLFPPFFQFLMPRREPQPNPEKAAELLRSLPTVGKRLLNRVNNVVAAQDVDSYEDDDDKGWKCGICLEGIHKEKLEKGEGKAVGDGKTEGEKEDKGTGVKALPCNHLFHGDCLEPWFTTHHTCPTCRLDLDPLQTLNSPLRPGPARNNSFRPARTGAGRSTSNAHPYSPDQSRNGERDQNDTAGDQVSADASGSGDNSRSNTPQERGQRSSLTPHLFIFAGPNHPREPQQEHSPEAANDAAAVPHDPTSQPAEPPSANVPTGGEAPTTPGGNSRPSASHRPFFDPAEILGAIFGGPPSASPLPMHRHSSPFPSSPGENATQSSNVPLSGNTGSTPTSQSGGSEPQDASSVESQPASEQSAQPPPSDRPQPERRAHIQIIQEALEQLPFIFNNHPIVPPLPTAFPFPGMVPVGERPSTPNAVDHTTDGSTAGAPSNGDTATAADEALGAGQAQSQTSAKQPFVPQSLESWTEEKEKSLGWRCDAPECVYGPSTSEEDDDSDGYPPTTDELEEDQKNKEMVSIFSAVQPPLSSAEAKEAHENDHDFTLLACTHRWHRGCLEIAERSAGRMSKDDGEGRIWVRCERCRKDGWIPPVAESTGSGVGRKRKEAEMTV